MQFLASALGAHKPLSGKHLRKWTKDIAQTRQSGSGMESAQTVATNHS